MSQSTAAQMRQWQGLALFSYGFRPLFLAAGLWAFAAMVLWVLMLAGQINLPSRFDPVSWHAHEFLFGYLGAVVAGFLLTAVPNWTGRLPVVGWPLAGLTLLWLIGRVAVAISAQMPPLLVLGCDLVFSVVLWLVMLREIIVGKNWRNLPVLILVAALTLANLLFHLEGMREGYPAGGLGLRLGVGVILVLIMLIGGKIIPSFTRNYLAKLGQTRLPVPPMQRFDKIAVLAGGLTLLAWAIAPRHALVGLALLALAGLHFARLLRWRGLATRAEPLVWVLHLAYAFVPLGAFLMAVAALLPDVMPEATALHVWTAGAMGLMTLAVMSRATLGHTGRDLHAGGATVAIYLALVGAVLARVAADVLPEVGMMLLYASALLWCACFAGFSMVYGSILIRRAGAEQP